METLLFTAPYAALQRDTVPVWLLRESEVTAWREGLSEWQRRWVQAQEFAGERHRLLSLPATDGSVAGLAYGLGRLERWREFSLWHTAGLADKLPLGCYRFEFDPGLNSALEKPFVLEQAALGYLLGSYRMNRYRRDDKPIGARLGVADEVDVLKVLRHAEACTLARDLVNLPANDLGPEELAAAVVSVARRFGAEVTQLVGDELLTHGYPLIHAVGRASVRPPRLLDLRWGDPSHPRVTLVGKGVCFDSGGLDIKPASGMLLMKKDMGGAAIALGVAQALMARAAPVRLRLLIPAVENAVSGAAFRPGDVLASRKGLRVEIGNTDAEGRLVLADALTEADSEAPELLLDFATLTGAARVALGPELPALFTDDESLRDRFVACGRALCDPVWPLPMWSSYDDELGSRIADLNNVSPSSFAGAIFGALFLRRFVTPGRRWAHFDVYAWNSRERPGRPVGAEAQVLRLADAVIAQLWG